MTTNTTIDLTPFLSKEEDYGRYAFHEPFVRNGWRYATDGGVCVRVLANGEADTEGKFPDSIDSVFSRTTPVSPQPWPHTPFVQGKIDCEACDGEGYIGRERCEECNGVGEHACPHCDQDMECEECDGKGYATRGTKCGACNESGTVSGDHYQIIGDYAVAAKYVKKIKALPGVQWTGNTPGGRVCFDFDGGSGVVIHMIL